jgi:hypothetical protein
MSAGPKHPTMAKSQKLPQKLGTPLAGANSLHHLVGHFERCTQPLCTYCGNAKEAWMCNACKAVYATEAEAAGCPCPMHTHASLRLGAIFSRRLNEELEMPVNVG